MSFIHLHVHSYYSLLRGADRIEDLCRRAAEYRMPAMALTDRNGLYGAVAFQKACDENGIKPIFGAQLATDTSSCVALVKNWRGYRNLCRIITALHQEKGEKPFDLAESLIQHREGLICFSLDADLLTRLRQAGGPDDLYVEVYPGREARAWGLHRALGLPLLATNNAWLAGRDGYARHRLLTAIGLNTCLSGIPTEELAGEDHWLKPPEMMQHTFRGIPEAVTNTWRVADECDFQLQLGSLHLPRFPFADGKSSWELLREKTEIGLIPRYGTVTPEVRAQVERELAIIHEMGYADYFLIVADIVDAAKGMGIPTCGRGSAANSVVAYVLELTHVEPLSNNLYFERFLNRGRSDCPDVDIDFSWKDRDRVIDWAFRRYGADRTAMISTHVSFASRGAVREIAKVWGVPPARITQISKQLPSSWDKGSIADAVKRDPRCRNLPIHEEPWRTIFELAEQINGFPKHLGIHAGGIVIAPSQLCDYVPVQPAAKEIESGRIVVTQWDMYPIEDAGLVKIDLLGNRSLAVIDDVIGTLKENSGTVIDYTQFDPTEDHATKEIIRRGDTMGCFYIESPSMRNLLLKLDCHSYDGLVAASSIIRPGISSSGMMQEYILRSNYTREQGGQDTDWYLHPLMRKALGETFGVMAYQEDVLKVAEMVARMSPEDSDGLRKAMSKKRDFVAIERYRRQFIAGALANGCSLDITQELWRQIESFSGYSFCKAHSASFALVSYQAAYLRAHYPAEFIAAVLSNHGGYYSTRSYISEARRMGLRVLLPCVNAGRLDYMGTDNWVRVGLGQLQHVQRRNLEGLIDERDRNGPFRDFGDFLLRVPMPPTEVDQLIRSGALDSIAHGLNRPQMLRQHTLFRAADQAGHSREPGLFGQPVLPPVPRVRDYTAEQKYTAEAETLGCVVSVHPLELFERHFEGIRLTKATDLQRHVGRRIKLAGWQVTRKRLRTKHGDPMCFVTYEDTSGLYETVIFPREYNRLAPIISASGPFLVIGEVAEELGALTLTVQDLKLLADANPLTHRIPERSIWGEDMQEAAA